MKIGDKALRVTPMGTWEGVVTEVDEETFSVSWTDDSETVYPFQRAILVPENQVPIIVLQPKMAFGPVITPDE